MNVSGLYIDILLKVVITMNFFIRTVLLRMMLKISALLNQFVLIMFTMRAKMIMFMMIIFQGLYYEAVIYFYFAFWWYKIFIDHFMVMLVMVYGLSV